MYHLIHRQRDRISVSLPLTVCFHENAGELVAWQVDPVVENTFTENVSSGGCYFSLSRGLPLGMEIEMEITIPGGLLGGPEEKVCCRGRVLRVESPDGSGKVGVASTIDSFHFGKASDPRRDSRATPVV